MFKGVLNPKLKKGEGGLGGIIFKISPLKLIGNSCEVSNKGLPMFA